SGPSTTENNANKRKMLKNKPLAAWKRKKSEVEARISRLQSLREQSTVWLKKVSENRTELLWRRKDYLNFIEKQQRLTKVIRETAIKLDQAKQELADADRNIRLLEKNISRTAFTAGGIITLMLMLALFNYAAFFELGDGFGDSALTGAVVSIPGPEEGDSDAVIIPAPPVEEIPMPPPEEISPTIPEPEKEVPDESIDQPEDSHITIPELPEEAKEEVLPKTPLPEAPALNETINNSTGSNSTTNATEKVDLEIQIIPTSHPGINRYTFRHALGAQGAVLRGNGNDSIGNIMTGRFIVNPFQPGTNNISNFSQPVEYRAKIGFLANANTSSITPAAADTTPPNVTNITPALNSRFNFSTSIEISANVTDSSSVSAVNVSILLPNGTTNVLTLSLSALNSKYNASYTIPNLTGFYNVTILANDSTNKINNTEFTNFTAVNAAPAVYWVAPVHSQSITEGGIAQIINISFNVSDANGKDDIDNSSAQIRINLVGETDRTNSSCVASSSTSTTIQFNCTVGVWYFDGAGSWTINVSVRDKSSTYAENRSTTFELLSTTAMTMSPNALTWPTVELGRTNITANNDPIRINNTGNKNIAVGGITVTGYNLQGITTPTEFINAENFSIFPVNNTGSGGPIECNGTQMFNGTSGTAAPQVISIANITRGNNSIDDGTAASGQEELFVCLRFIPAGITRQGYSTAGASSGPWTVAIS
ncbi:MAG: Ig-like domain-containing protein, partial [Nanoarchaeota archaeon]|nr:Ig-like domain-containing protein [Nanoarchaeota archaeon]